MKKIILGLFAITLVVSGAFAQDSTKARVKKNHGDKSFHARPNHNLDHFKSLNLTKEQQDKAAVINKEFRTGIQELKKKEATITVKDYKAQQQALNKKRQEQFQQILTPSQKEQAAKMKAEKGKRGPAMAKKHQQKMKQELGLTDDQSAKLNTLRQDTRKQVESIRNNQALTEDQKKEQTMAAFKKQREEMKSVLTPEQVKKMEAMPKPNRRNFSK